MILQYPKDKYIIMPEISFDAAKSHVIRFGKHVGKSIFDTAATDDGLKYLDWLVGQDWFKGYTRECVERYLNEPSIKKELDELI
jgi:hypothetical protein